MKRLLIITIVFFFCSCDILEPDSSSDSANCVFTKHSVTTRQTQVGNGSVTYNVYHMTTIKNKGNQTANDVKIIIYLNGSSVGSVNVTGSLSAGQSIDKNFNTTTVGSSPTLKLWWE